jgi:hypothetical protein
MLKQYFEGKALARDFARLVEQFKSDRLNTKTKKGHAATTGYVHPRNPIPRKHFQLPSGSFFRIKSTVPRTCAGVAPGDAIIDALN